MSGFKSPLPILGIGTTVPAVTSGQISPLPGALGRIGTGIPGGGKSGFRTPLPFWNAGTSTPVVNTYGFRTPLPFWNAGTTVISVPSAKPAYRRVYRQDYLDELHALAAAELLKRQTKLEPIIKEQKSVIAKQETLLKSFDIDDVWRQELLDELVERKALLQRIESELKRLYNATTLKYEKINKIKKDIVNTQLKLNEAHRDVVRLTEKYVLRHEEDELLLILELLEEI